MVFTLNISLIQKLYKDLMVQARLLVLARSLLEWLRKFILGKK